MIVKGKKIIFEIQGNICLPVYVCENERAFEISCEN